MLDRRTEKLLEKLNALCKSAAFCLVEEGELISAGEDGESVKGMLGFLKDRGYLEIQYAEGGEYCIRMLPEGRLYSERETAEKQGERRRNRREFFSALIGGLVGALVGGGLIVLIALLA